MEICGRDAFFFYLHLTLDGKVDSADVMTIFCSFLDFGLKTDVMTFKEFVLLLRSENIFGPVAWLQSRRQSSRLGGPSVYQGGTKFEIKHNLLNRLGVLLKSNPVDGGGSMSIGGARAPSYRPCLALNCAPPSNF